jgi:Fic family protein
MGGQMKLPESAPNWSKHYGKGLALRNNSEISELISKANRECLYWDKFKYQSFPKGTNKEHAWAALKISREFMQRKSPITDVKGREFTYWLSDYADQLLYYIAKNSGWDLLADGIDLKEEKGKYVKQLIMEEAITSSQIEGAATTRVVAKEMLRSNRKPKNHSERMIYNNFLTINNIKEGYKDYPLSAELIKDIHKDISSGTLEDASQEGRFREGSDGPVKVVNDRNDTILHTPPPVEAIDGSIEEICDYVNSEPEEFIHPVIKGIVLHFWIAYLHPFLDGNGRTSRALFYWYMLRNGYESFEFISISKYIKEKQTKYYRSFLYSEIDESDLTYFIIYNLEAIKGTIDDVKKYLARKHREKAEVSRATAEYVDLNYRQKQILADAIENPSKIFTIKEHQGIHDVVYQTARTDLMQLEEQGLLTSKKKGKKFVFMVAADLKEKS